MNYYYKLFYYINPYSIEYLLYLLQIFYLIEYSYYSIEFLKTNMITKKNLYEK